MKTILSFLMAALVICAPICLSCKKEKQPMVNSNNNPITTAGPVLPPVRNDITIIAAWKPAVNGFMFLEDTSRMGSESTFSFGYGAENNLEKEYTFYIKPPQGDLIELDYVPLKDTGTTSLKLFVSSFIIDDQEQPIYYPTIYAKQNAVIDFTKKISVSYKWR